MNHAPKDQRFSYAIAKYWKYFLPCWLFAPFVVVCGIAFNGAIKDWNPLLLNALLLGPFFGVNLWAYRAKKFVPHSLFILLTTFVPFAIGVIFVICLYVGDLWLKSMNTGGDENIRTGEGHSGSGKNGAT